MTVYSKYKPEFLFTDVDNPAYYAFTLSNIDQTISENVLTLWNLSISSINTAKEGWTEVNVLVLWELEQPTEYLHI